VARGEMAWIGPRPIPLAIHACLPQQYRARSDVRPGLTGAAQTMHGRSAPLSERFEADCRYAATKSWRGDLAIALRTPRHLFSRSSVQDLADVDDIGLRPCLAASKEAGEDAAAR
jgi:lipopolysaccharide/colanic/teichoic acid biosynthesis glycosyltransferase